jgi:RAD50-interacting protein 1
MRNALKLLDWPNQIKSSQRTNEGLQQLKLAFQNMPILQPASDASSSSLPSSGVLLPFKVMARDIDIRFRYHFEGDRQTNNIEKVRHQPEFLISAGMVLSKYPQNT